jgi:hypothetical protein
MASRRAFGPTKPKPSARDRPAEPRRQPRRLTTCRFRPHGARRATASGHGWDRMSPLRRDCPIGAIGTGNCLLDSNVTGHLEARPLVPIPSRQMAVLGIRLSASAVVVGTRGGEPCTSYSWAGRPESAEMHRPPQQAERMSGRVALLAAAAGTGETSLISSLGRARRYHGPDDELHVPRGMRRMYQVGTRLLLLSEPSAQGAWRNCAGLSNAGDDQQPVRRFWWQYCPRRGMR